jgi:hypothetical protein
VKFSNDYHFFRGSGKKDSERYKIASTPTLLILDMDGDEVARTQLSQSKQAVYEALKNALEQYKNQDVSWSTGTTAEAVEAAKKEGKLVVLTFADDKEDSTKVLQALGHRVNTKFHGKVVFVKAEFSKDGEEARTWSVSSAPTLVAINPEDGKALDRLTGKAGGLRVRSFLSKSLGKLQKETGQK